MNIPGFGWLRNALAKVLDTNRMISSKLDALTSEERVSFSGLANTLQELKKQMSQLDDKLSALQTSVDAVKAQADATKAAADTTVTLVQQQGAQITELQQQVANGQPVTADQLAKLDAINNELADTTTELQGAATELQNAASAIPPATPTGDGGQQQPPAAA